MEGQASFNRPLASPNPSKSVDPCRQLASARQRKVKCGSSNIKNTCPQWMKTIPHVYHQGFWSITWTSPSFCHHGRPNHGRGATRWTFPCATAVVSSCFDPGGARLEDLIQSISNQSSTKAQTSDFFSSARRCADGCRFRKNTTWPSDSSELVLKVEESIWTRCVGPDEKQR